MRPVADYAIVPLHIGFHVLEEITGKFIHLPLEVAGRTKAEQPGVAGRHDDDHRLCLARGNQIVEDEPGTADGAPRCVAIERAVQQVEDRILALALLVTRWRVDVHAPKALESLRRVSDL